MISIVRIILSLYITYYASVANVANVSLNNWAHLKFNTIIYNYFDTIKDNFTV